MGSRASTQAGRRRASARAGAARGTPAKRRPPSKKAPSKKAPAKKAPPKKAPPKKALNPRNVAVVAGLAVLALAATYQFWFRDSAFVAVEAVSVAGISGPEAERVTAALTDTAAGMTTLNVRQDELAGAVAGFPTVVGVSAEADFPHGLTVTVQERPPVLIATEGDRSLPVAGDGAVLPGVDVKAGALPALTVADLPASGELEGEALAVAQVVGAAPEPLGELIEAVGSTGDGVEVTLRGEIPVFFGGVQRTDEKWAAAAAILADREVRTLTHLDLRVPERPSIGGAAPPAPDPAVETPVE